jgi:uncharacterized protein (DUF1501 family)
MRRQNFLLAAAAGLAVIAQPDHVFARALAQAPLPGLPGSERRCLVLVNLYGGNDGLNCVVPHGDAGYYQLRPGLAIAQSDVLAIDARVGLNPGMRSLKALYDKGMVAIVQGAGYPNPDHSHFRSTEIWQTAAPDRYEHTGWLGRYFDAAGLSGDSGSRPIRVDGEQKSDRAQRLLASGTRRQLAVRVAVSGARHGDRGRRTAQLRRVA